jgi:hypothetical protein
MQDQEVPRVELFWTLEGTESGLAGAGLAAARLIAVYRLDADGRALREVNRAALREADLAPDWLDKIRVFEPGDPTTLVHTSEGERHLRALPAAFTGTSCRAVLITAQDNSRR